jgi:hypothetical protein
MTEDRGFAGASAYREARLAGGTRDRRDWRAGAVGESIVGRQLAELDDRGVRAVHDRAVPGSLGNIDHIAVTPMGVYVIDAKNYSGQPRVETEPGPDPTPRRLFIGRDDHTHLVHAVRGQVRVVLGALDEPGVPVRGILCFVGAEWQLLNGYLFDGVGITSTDGLAALLALPGPLDTERVDVLHQRLVSRLDSR